MAALAVAAGLILVGGCSDNAPTAQNPIGSTRVTLPPAPTTTAGTSTGGGSSGTETAPPTATSTLRNADKGKTVTIKVGEPVTLTLTGTDWGFTDPKPPQVLTPMSPPIVAPEKGSSSISFRAAKPGTATVTATRANGETFQITIVVQ